MRRVIAVLAILLVAAAGPAAADGQGRSRAPFPSEPNDTYLEMLWHLRVIEAPEAWRYADGRGIRIAIFDRGIDTTHPDIGPNVVAMKDFRPSSQRSGFTSSHGMHVGGIAAAVGNNGTGVVGVAPRARLIDVRHNFSDDTDVFLREVRWAVRAGADVINMSFGDSVPILFASSEEDVAKIDAVFDHAWKKGVVLVASADNLALPMCNHPASGYRVLCVGATNSLDLKSSYSNSDARREDTYVTAPGGEVPPTYGVLAAACEEQILSTYLMEPEDLVPVILPHPSACAPEPGYEFESGTSMAAPVVAGVAALVMSTGLSNEEAVERILETADDLGAPGWDPIYGYGRVNALRAVTGN